MVAANQNNITIRLRTINGVTSMRKFHGKFKTRPFNLSLLPLLLLFRSSQPHTLIHSFILCTALMYSFILVSQWQTRSNYTFGFWSIFEKPAFHFHSMCECVFQRDEKERERNGMGCIRTYIYIFYVQQYQALQFLSLYFFLFLLRLLLNIFTYSIHILTECQLCMYVYIIYILNIARR